MFLKRYAEWCAKYLFVLFSRSLSECELPDDWRTATIKPIHKKRDKLRFSNYRPTSILSSSCQILEHIIHKHISNFVEEHNVRTKFQHGLRRCHSTCTQLVETLHDFASSINDGIQTDVFLLILKKLLIQFLTINFCTN